MFKQYITEVVSIPVLCLISFIAGGVIMYILLSLQERRKSKRLLRELEISVEEVRDELLAKQDQIKEEEESKNKK